MTTINALLTAVLLLSAGPTTAKNIEAIEVIEVIEVYGNFEPAIVNQLPSSIWVMEYEQIQSITGSTAMAVLTHIPGITTRNSGGVQEIFLRGAETNFVVIQIDGIQVNNPLDSRGGGFDLASIAKSSLVRVEVTKGAQSLSYGSDAIAGVINFVTIETGATKGEITAGIMPKGQKVLGLRGAIEQYAATLNVLETDQQIDGQGLSQIELALLGEFKPTDSSKTRVNLRLGDYQQQAFPDQSGGALLSTAQDKDKKESELFAASVRHLQIVNEEYQTALQVEYLHTQERLSSPGIKPYFNAPPTATKNEYRFHKVRWLNKLEFASLSATLGLDYKSESGTTRGFIEMFGQGIETNYQHDRDNLGGFADIKWSLGSLSLFAGARHDSTADFSEESTWKLAADYRFNDDFRFFVNWGTAFKLPSLYALSNNLIGNPELKPETAENIDLALNWSGDQATLSLAVFQYDYQNLVDFDGEIFSLVNRSKIQSQGSELIATYTLFDNLSVSADITYVDVAAPSSELLTGRPKWQGGLAAAYQVSPTVRTHAKLRYVGSAAATSLHSGEFSVHELDAYNRFDIAIEWQLGPHQRLDVHFENVLDHSYQQAVGFPGNEFGVGAQFYWQLGSK